MAVIQPNLYIPDAIYAGLISGQYVRYGGVVRNAATGAIVKQLKEIPGKDDVTEQALSLSKKAGNLLKTSKGKYILVGIGAAAVVGIAAYVIQKKNSEKTSTDETSQAEVPQCVRDYNEALSEYLDAINSRELDDERIDRLVRCIEEVQEENEKGTIAIEFSPKQLTETTSIIVKYTKALAEANEKPLAVLDVDANQSSEEMLNVFQFCLKEQKKIFEDAS